MLEKAKIVASGETAIADAKEELEPYVGSEDAVTRVEVTLVMDTSDDEEPAQNGSDDDDEGRELKTIDDPDTKKFDLLELIARNPEVTNEELREIGDFDSTVSPTTSKLHEQMLVDREKESRTYYYSVTEFGVANLRQHGVDI